MDFMDHISSKSSYLRGLFTEKDRISMDLELKSVEGRDTGGTLVHRRHEQV
jgi:hypothetical protein